jgi:hypothetical protein
MEIPLEREEIFLPKQPRREVRKVTALAPLVEHAQVIEMAWLPFLDTYRTMCVAPEPAFRQILEDIRVGPFAGQ